jgi:transposase
MLRQLIEQALSDAPRSGAPAIFTPEQVCLLIALACETSLPHLSVWSRKIWQPEQSFYKMKSHRIRFVYTPKHCSRLNQVEIWFGILSPRLLKRGEFKSTAELKERILKFIDFFNQTLAKPFRWTYIGKPLMA